ncbi:MAG: DNA polymerase I [Candidatus Lambdaproteobacteria bacterium]|nr:DNA polymerase I [Candidatus Lambdaproteobacteria bacterium]
MATFYAIDTMAVLYRSYFAMIRNPLINSRGVNTSGLHGLVNTLIGILEREAPDYLAVVSDSPEPTFRHERFADYKATREKMPDDLVQQLPYIPRIVETLRLPYLVLPGYEADDIIGTLVQEAQRRKLDTYMVTGDKDYMQLINDRVRMYSARGEEVTLTGREGVREKFGCAPEQVVELLALMGDSSDNVPGVRGVGPKTAAKLIQDYGTLEGIYEHLDGIKGDKLRQNLAEHKGMAFLSRELVTIQLNVPLEGDFDALRMHPTVLSENQPLIDLLTELEFQSLRDKLIKKSAAVAVPTPGDDVRYVTLDSTAAIRAELPRWRAAPMLVMDTETTGLDVIGDRIVGLSFAVEGRQAWYIPLNHPNLAGQRAKVFALLRPLLGPEGPPKCGHNIKYDMHMLQGEGVPVENVRHDTMIASHLTEPAERRHDLDSVALRRLGFTKIPTEELIGKGKTQVTMDQVPIPQVARYACEDADITMRLYDVFMPRLRETSQLAVFDGLEVPLIPVLMRLERAGIRFDSAGAERLSEETARKLETLRGKIYELAGERDFNINSILDLQRVLYDRLKLHEELKIRPKKIKTGNGFSTDEETLEKMARHPLPRTLLDYRLLAKLKSTYLDQLSGFVNPKTGRIHSSFRQAVAATGRLASDNPNLQNIPVRSDEGRKVRALFLPADAEHVLLSADYNQIELRVVADYSGDPTFVQAFKTGEDIHRLTAATIFDVQPQDVDRDMRSVAKEVNFGLIYRMGADRLAQVTNTTRDQAREFIRRFFEKYATIRALQDELMDKARKEGYALTRLGRRRYLPEINSSDSFAARTAEGMAINTPIQGTAAEIIKLAMIRVDRRMREARLRSRMVLTIHDELLFDAHKDELDALSALVTEEMEQAMPLAVPLKVELGTGDNWLAAH